MVSLWISVYFGSFLAFLLNMLELERYTGLPWHIHNLSLKWRCLRTQNNKQITINTFYDTVSAPIAVTREEISGRLKIVCETASLYNGMMGDIEYGQDIKRHCGKRRKSRRRINQRILKREDRKQHRFIRTLKVAY